MEQLSLLPLRACSTTLTCCTCRQSKEAEEFSYRYSRTGERARYCRACKSVYNRRWYERHREAQIARVRSNTERHRQALRDIVSALKDRPCQDCRQRFAEYMLDFDHVRGRKRANISQLVRNGVSRDVLLDEIVKCDLVCANCHRKRTLGDVRGTPS